MDPVTWAAIIAAVIAAAASASAAYVQSQNANAVSEYTVKTQNNQATAARQAAEMERAQQEDRLRRSYAHQRAMLGGAGVVDEGSPLLVMLDSVQQGELALSKITYAGELQARGNQSNAILAAAQGDIALQEGRISAGGSLLSGAAKAYSGYARASASPAIKPSQTEYGEG